MGSADAVKTPLARHTKNIILLITVPSAYIVSGFPAVSSSELYHAMPDGILQGIVMYWTSANLFSLGQSWLLKQPWVKDWLDLNPPVKPPVKGFKPEPDPTIGATLRWIGTSLRGMHVESRDRAVNYAKARAKRREVAGTETIIETPREAPRRIKARSTETVIETPSRTKAGGAVATPSKKSRSVKPPSSVGKGAKAQIGVRET